MECEHTFVTGMILHADVDAFFAAVEQRDDPRLRGRPTVVGGGVVMAASYEARAFGIRGAMGGRQARRLCPHLNVVRPRFDAYTQASREVFEIFRDTAPSVEGISMEEAFLDVSGLERISGTPREIAARLRRRVREQVGLVISVGIATTKIAAKMASRSAKPDGLLEVPRRRGTRVPPRASRSARSGASGRSPRRSWNGTGSRRSGQPPSTGRPPWRRSSVPLVAGT